MKSDSLPRVVDFQNPPGWTNKGLSGTTPTQDVFPASLSSWVLLSPGNIALWFLAVSAFTSPILLDGSHDLSRSLTNPSVVRRHARPDVISLAEARELALRVL